MKNKWKIINSDISWEHCGRPAYWEDYEVYCSKCQTQLKEKENA